MEKVCIKCKKKQNIEQFNKRKDSLDGYRNECKTCKKESHKEYHILNREKYNEKCRQYDASHKKEKRDYNQNYYSKNRKKIIKQNDAYKQNKRDTDLLYRLADNQRTRLYIAIKNNQKQGSAIRDLGCSIPELKEHIEKQWQEGMSWDNWTLDGWHIDHIKPLASFDLTDLTQFKAAVHYTNLQPMWAENNLSKGAKVYDIPRNI